MWTTETTCLSSVRGSFRAQRNGPILHTIHILCSQVRNPAGLAAAPPMMLIGKHSYVCVGSASCHRFAVCVFCVCVCVCVCRTHNTVYLFVSMIIRVDMVIIFCVLSVLLVTQAAVEVGFKVSKALLLGSLLLQVLLQNETK